MPRPLDAAVDERLSYCAVASTSVDAGPASWLLRATISYPYVVPGFSPLLSANTVTDPGTLPIQA